MAVLFGEGLITKMIESVKLGKDFVFPVDKKIDDQIKVELAGYKVSRRSTFRQFYCNGFRSSNAGGSEKGINCSCSEYNPR